jgi:hypothetical protein
MKIINTYVVNVQRSIGMGMQENILAKVYQGRDSKAPYDEVYLLESSGQRSTLERITKKQFEDYSNNMDLFIESGKSTPRK